MFVRVLCVLFTFLLVSCASFVPALKSSATIDSKKAYIYGRFTLNDTPLRIGVEVAGPKIYRLEFKEADQVSMIAVEPGTYHLSQFIFATADTTVTDELPIKDEVLKSTMALEAGKAYYIGDFAGVANYRYAEEMNWRVTEINNHFEATTRDLELKYPQFARLPKQQMRGIELFIGAN